MNHIMIFVHGLESSSQGTKALALKKKFPAIVIPDFKGPFPERMKALEEELKEADRVFLIGSSFGGLQCAAYACAFPRKVEKAVLFAPAVSLPEFDPFREASCAVPVTIYHGTQDTVIPIGPVRAVAEKVFSTLTFHSVEDDHRLLKTFHALCWDTLVPGSWRMF